jgi:RNA polymerase sigma-70 factor (ECF subfamily)
MSQQASDLELLTRWRAGDNGAGGTLIKRHFSALHRFFANKAYGHEEDLIQTTFAACVEAKDAFRAEASFRTYLFKLARFQLLTHYRKTHRNKGLDFTTTSIRDLGTSPSGALLRREEQLLLERALQQVPIDQQIALELTYWEDLPARDVAEVLGIPENTVYSRLRRGKDHLRDALARLSEVPEERELAAKLLTGSDDD